MSTENYTANYRKIAWVGPQRLQFFQLLEHIFLFNDPLSIAMSNWNGSVKFSWRQNVIEQYIYFGTDQQT